MKRIVFLTLVVLQLLFNGAITPIYYRWLHTETKIYSLVLTCMYGISALPLLAIRRYTFVIVSLVAHMVPFIVDIGISLNFISAHLDYFYIQLLANIVFDIPIYIFGIFYISQLGREIIDPYARFGDVSVFAH